VEGIGGAGVDSNLYVCFVQLQTNGTVVERGNILTAKDRAQAEFETTTVEPPPAVRYYLSSVSCSPLARRYGFPIRSEDTSWRLQMYS
jgi:hypothetical protein